MLRYKVKRILLDHERDQVRPWNITQLAAAMDMSERNLQNMLGRGRPDDIERIAIGLGIDPSQLDGD